MCVFVFERVWVFMIALTTTVTTEQIWAWNLSNGTHNCYLSRISMHSTPPLPLSPTAFPLLLSLPPSFFRIFFALRTLLVVSTVRCSCLTKAKICRSISNKVEANKNDTEQKKTCLQQQKPKQHQTTPSNKNNLWFISHWPREWSISATRIQVPKYERAAYIVHVM